MAGVTQGSVTSYISAYVAGVKLGSVTSYISAEGKGGLQIPRLNAAELQIRLNGVLVHIVGGDASQRRNSA